MNDELLQRIKNCKTLPAVPALPMEVMQMCRREDADISQMAKLISQDPTFVGKILNVANSSFYGGARHKVTTVTQAIALLGMNSIATLAFCFSLYRDLRRHGGKGVDHQQFWRRSLFASIAGRVLGRWAKVADCEEIFLAALLQDIGIMVLGEIYADQYGDIMSRAGRNHNRLQELEREQFQADHADVGAWLADSWQLPELLQVIIQGSHNTSQVTAKEEYGTVTQCVALSGIFADVWCDPETDEATKHAVSAAKELMGIEASELSALFTQVAEGFQELSGFFPIELGKADEIQEKLAKAQEILCHLTPADSLA